ncbi:MAG: hypothetical protein ABEJ77_03610 [Halanaeroarchaeum sp.]
MTIVQDERGRVPFALIAALLLIGSVTYTGGLVSEEPSRPVVPRLVEDATEAARIHLGTVARAAGRAAAREPALAPAQTRIGRLLADDPFRRTLELRVAVGARDRVPLVRSGGDARITVAVAPIDGVAGVSRALEGVSIRHLLDDRYRVSLANVTVTVWRDGRAIERHRVTLETTVALPAVAVHERVQTFERRLSASAIQPGLTRGLTARLFAVAWARGYAQYGGAPIANVVANRHVEVLVNDALVDQQVAAFGVADPRSRRGVSRAYAAVAVADGVRGAENAAIDAMAKYRNGDAPAVSDPRSTRGRSLMNRPRDVDVDRRADVAFGSFVDRGGIRQALLRAYQAEVRPDATVRLRDRSVATGSAPPRNATRWFSHTTTDVDVSGGGGERGTGGTLLRYERTVTETETEHTYWWHNGSVVGPTERSVERTYAVTVALACRYARPTATPGGPIAGRCPFDDAARADLQRAAATAMGSRFGGVDDVASNAVTGDRSYGWRTVAIDPPASATARAYRETASLREAVRSISVPVRPASIASTANPASRLRERIRSRWDAVLDAPSRYDGAANVGATLARQGYLHALDADLGHQSAAFAGVQDALGDLMARRGVPARAPTADADALPPIASAVVVEPRYLSLSARRGDPALAARNVNVFTLPFGDVADTVTAGVGKRDSVSLSTATATLLTAERVEARTTDAAVDRSRRRLERAVAAALSAVRDEQRRALARNTALSRRQAERAIGRAYAASDSVGTAARAVVEGTIVDRVVAALPPSLDARTRDRARVELRVATTEALDARSVRTAERTVSTAVERVRPHVRAAVGQAVERSARAAIDAGATLAKKRGLSRAAATIPAGLPLVPIPSQWYATANVWVVSARGGYERIAVRVPRATPAFGDDGAIPYVRESAAVRIDVDGDGTAETVGRNEPIEFAVHTGVFVVVPPGPAGVGDTDGNADERSPGW